MAGHQGLTRHRPTRLTPAAGTGRARRLSALAWRRPWLGLAGLMAPAAAWFAVIYLAALAMLLVTAFWSVDDLTGALDRTFTLANFRQLAAGATNRAIVLRTVGLAAAVTVADVLIAFPFAYVAARIAGPRLKLALFTLVMLPLWSSYLARVYAWRLILAHDGILNWALGTLGWPAADLGYSRLAMGIVYVYLWLPFMITPLQAALERIPESMLEASGDLGARPWRTLLSVVLPLSLPGLLAGSLFTFSLTLGDYVTPLLVGGPGSDLIGNVVYANVGIANDIPFASAVATVPLVVMAAYLLLARRFGALDTL
jgi:putative spermidine/putrescine transport system permease protein